jgi:hypothetical protein
MTTDTAARIIPPAGCPDACWLAAVILEHRALSPPDANGITRLADGTELATGGWVGLAAELERRHWIARHAGTSTDVGSTRHDVTGWLIHWDQIRSELGTP